MAYDQTAILNYDKKHQPLINFKIFQKNMLNFSSLVDILWYIQNQTELRI